MTQIATKLDRPPGAVVLGLTANGLGVLHSLAEMTVCPEVIIGIETNPGAIGFTSRVGRKVVVPSPWSEDGTLALNVLLNIAASEARRLVLYPSGDDWVSFASKHRDALQPYYYFLLPAPDIVDALLDKACFADLAHRLSLPAPHTEVVRAEPGTVPEGRFRFPLVAKPLSSWSTNRLRSSMKALEFTSPQQWDAYFATWEGSGELVLIQEKVEGDEQSIFFYGGLWKRGREIAGFTGRKLRQFQKNYGSSTRVICEPVEDVKRLSIEILSRLEYSGLVDVEFKRDARDGSLKLIEINARQGLWHRVGRAIGVDLIQLAFQLLCGHEIPRQNRGTRAGHWSYLSRDLRRLAEDIRMRPASAGQWLWSYRQLPTDALFSWRDPLPWCSALFNLARNPAVRVLGRSRQTAGRTS